MRRVFLNSGSSLQEKASREMQRLTVQAETCKDMIQWFFTQAAHISV